jgi:hypothetical protein
MSDSVNELRRALQAKDREIAAFISKTWGFGDYPGGLDEKQRRRVEEEVGDLIEKHAESQEARVAATPIEKLLQQRHQIAELLAGR